LEKIKRYTAGAHAEFYGEEDDAGEYVHFLDYSKLNDDLEAERRVSYAMACALGDISEALGMYEIDPGTLFAVKELIQKLNEAKTKLQISNAYAQDLVVNERGELEAIYLQLHGDQYEEPADYRADEITWCWHRIHADDVRYIREDISRQIAIPGLIPTTFRAWWSMVEGARDDEGTPFKDSDIALDSGYGANTSVTAGEIRKMLK